jgi:hypothetical protein
MKKAKLIAIALMMTIGQSFAKNKNSEKMTPSEEKYTFT